MLPLESDVFTRPAALLQGEVEVGQALACSSQGGRQGLALACQAGEVLAKARGVLLTAGLNQLPKAAEFQASAAACVWAPVPVLCNGVRLGLTHGIVRTREPPGRGPEAVSAAWAGRSCP